MSEPAPKPQDDAVGFFETPAVLTLPPRLEMRTVAQMVAAVSDSRGPIVLKANGVELVTSPGAQVLLAVARSGREVRVDAPSAAFLDCLALLGVDPELLNTEGADA